MIVLDIKFLRGHESLNVTGCGMSRLQDLSRVLSTHLNPPLYDSNTRRGHSQQYQWKIPNKNDVEEESFEASQPDKLSNYPNLKLESVETANQMQPRSDPRLSEQGRFNHIGYLHRNDMANLHYIRH